MAMVRATSYTRSRKAAKASIRYIQHRPGNAGQAIYRTLFDSEGKIERGEAYTLIDTAQKGSVFFRFVISPDPQTEDTLHDLLLREVTEQTMLELSDMLSSPISWVASIHADHTPKRHVHVLTVVHDKLNPAHFAKMRERATETCGEQRRERDYFLEQSMSQAVRGQAQTEATPVAVRDRGGAGLGG